MNVRPLPVAALLAAVALLSLRAADGAPAAPALTPISISQMPLFVSSSAKPNVLLTLANSNSMDEDPSGLAVGSANPNSRSEIARRVARSIITNYSNALRIGLMAFQQVTAGANAVVRNELHSSPYDISFNPANYDPAWTGDRRGPKRRFRQLNPSDGVSYIYYNVNLPFYDASNQGTGFCYSPTANAFNNGEVVSPMNGPWDSYRCFTKRVANNDNLPAWGNAASEAAAGYSGYFATFSFLPTDSDLGQGITDFGKMMAWNWVSATWFSNGSPGGGYLHVPIADVDAAQMTKLNAKLATSQFAVNAPFDATRPLQNAGLTPLEGTLYTIRDYFAGNLADAARGGPRAAPPSSCGKDFSVVLTNGLPSVKRNGTASADVATMLADATTAATAVKTQHVLNYIVGFALPFGVNPAQLDSIAAAGGTDQSYYATDETALFTQLNAVFADILVRSGAAGAVALNSGSIRSNSFVYQARFNTGDWSGQLQAFPINTDDGTLGAASWDAAARVKAQDWSTGRRIVTWRRSGARGVAFRWPANPAAPAASELEPAQIDALNTSPANVVDGRGSQRLAYLRGDTSNEGMGAAQFRVRNVSVLGDIVNSAPVYVGAPSMNSTDSTYADFKAALNARPKMIYVGANDGMLHGFDAATGDERLAYVPREVFGNLSALTGSAYTHRYLVDGSPTATDIRLPTKGWRTVLASGLAGGGRAVFALDVTNPGTFSEANAASIALWELSSADDADLGYTYAAPTLIRGNNGRALAIFGNGYNNTGSGKAVLFVVDLETGAVTRKITVGTGAPAQPNGLSTPAVVDLDGNGTADVVYAGDLAGNVWKFDLSSSDANDWDVAYTGTPLFVATDSTNARQPITTAIEVSRHPQGGVMVLFGTGRYIGVGDPLTTQTQTIYGVRDHGSTVADRSALVQQTVIATQAAYDTTFRAVSTNPVDYTTKSGWFLDLPDSGERVAVDPILRFKRLVVTTLVPSTAACSPGGTSWIMEIDYLNGGQPVTPPFDVNRDGIVDASDKINFVTLPDGNRPPSGMRLDAISSSPAVVTGFGTDGGVENKYLNQSTGAIRVVGEVGEPLASRRASWREVSP